MSRQPKTTRRRRTNGNPVADEIQHVRDLVALRDLLARRGATAAEVDSYEQTIRVARTRLACAVQRASTAHPAAA